MAAHIQNGDVEAQVQQQQKPDTHNEKKAAIVTTVDDDSSTAAPELRPAHTTLYMTAFLDILIALLPLYFVVFAVLAYISDGALASSIQNVAILQMAKLNPTLFPIVFALIMAKFLKAYANFRLERGATVGLIQHLLGSRSLVSSVMTPVKLRTSSFLVPLLVIMWLLNPIGGQTSLRVVTKESNYTDVATPFHFVDVQDSGYVPYVIFVDKPAILIPTIMNAALSSPATSKNNSQDSYLNVQIPMLEPLAANGPPGTDGWYLTSDVYDLKGVYAAIMDAFEIPNTTPELLYSSLLGTPITRGNNVSFGQPTISDSSKTGIDKAIEDLFGSDVMSTHSMFNFETSYMKADCNLRQASVEPRIVDWETAPNATKTTWNTTDDKVDNGRGLTIAYDLAHDVNSTRPRRIGIDSWIGHPAEGWQTWETSLSQAWCDLTTTFVEVEVFCSNGLNCTVSKMRQSRNANYNTNLTRLDFSPEGANVPMGSDETGWISQFFQDFVNSTAHAMDNERWPELLTPLESYFMDPVFPHAFSTQPVSADIYMIGSALFSTRLTQLLNTYWLAGIAPYTLVAGIQYDFIPDEEGGPVNTSYYHNIFDDGKIGTSQGHFYIEKAVLRCHKHYFAILLCVSILLFGAGLVTAYLDATRRGPDVLDDFVNSLRHSPYVHVDQGPSMEDGQDKARRLRGTVIQMGDVDPGGDYGYVAIGTPSERQPVERLDHRRYYS